MIENLDNTKKNIKIKNKVKLINFSYALVIYADRLEIQ
jgi:hypothetical protein